MSAHLADTLIRLVSGTAREDDELRQEVLKRFGRETDAGGIACVLIDEDEADGGVVAGSGFNRRVLGPNIHNQRHRVLHPGQLSIRIRVAGNARPAVLS